MSYREVIYRQYAAKFQGSGYRHQRGELVVYWTRAYRWFFRDWLPQDKSARLADVGCGGGQLIEALAGLGYRNCEGVDISEQQVGLAQQAGLNVTQGEVGPFLRSRLANYDLITAVDIAEHLTKDELLEFLEAAYLALKPGGRLILQMPNPAAPWGMKIRYGDLTHEVSLTPDCAGRLLGLVGFESSESRECGPVTSWRRLDGTIRWVLWKLLRLPLMAFELVETGNVSTPVYTRVYLASAIRPKSLSKPTH